MIKSTLSNLPIYYMSLFVMPGSVRVKLEGFMRRFLWSENGGESKLSLIRWSLVTQPNEYGGLGIKSLANMNKALLGKWLWWYNRVDDCLWKELVDGGMGKEEGISVLKM